MSKIVSFPKRVRTPLENIRQRALMDRGEINKQYEPDEKTNEILEENMQLLTPYAYRTIE